MISPHESGLSSTTLVDHRGAQSMRRFLVHGEEMVVVHRPHWMSLFGTFFALACGLIVTLWVGFTAPASLGWLADKTWYVLAAMLVFTAARVWLWSRDWFAATDQRLIWRRGILNQKTAMMPLQKVTDMSFNQPLIGRFLGYGEFVMESAGQDQALRLLTYIPHPEASYRAICGQLFSKPSDEPSPAMVPTRDSYDDRTDDTDPFLKPMTVDTRGADARRARPPVPVSQRPVPAVPESDVASRLGTYVDRYRDKARTPLRERLLRGPQPVDDPLQHEDAAQIEEPFQDTPWSVSTEHASPTHRVDRRRD
ncbi:PH domain-containing protein [Yimella sp. cx-573]|nr:PH domain-containing protein [Yimella sp. cx-573]